jgi:hypothetical protein
METDPTPTCCIFRYGKAVPDGGCDWDVQRNAMEEEEKQKTRKER